MGLGWRGAGPRWREVIAARRTVGQSAYMLEEGGESDSANVRFRWLVYFARYDGFRPIVLKNSLG